MGVDKNHVDQVKLLLSCGADPNKREVENGDAMLKKCKGAAVCKLLLCFGANPNIRVSGPMGWTNLFFLPLQQEQTEMAKLLVANGANPRVRNGDNGKKTPRSAAFLRPDTQEFLARSERYISHIHMERNLKFRGDDDDDEDGDSDDNNNKRHKSTPPSLEEVTAMLQAMRVRELRKILVAGGVDFSTCLEKSDFVGLILAGGQKLQPIPGVFVGSKSSVAARQVALLKEELAENHLTVQQIQEVRRDAYSHSVKYSTAIAISNAFAGSRAPQDEHKGGGQGSGASGQRGSLCMIAAELQMGIAGIVASYLCGFDCRTDLHTSRNNPTRNPGRLRMDANWSEEDFGGYPSDACSENEFGGEPFDELSAAAGDQ